MSTSIGKELKAICDEIIPEHETNIRGSLKERMSVGKTIDPMIIAFMNKLKEDGEKSPLTFLVNNMYKGYEDGKLKWKEKVLFCRLLDIQYMISKFKELKELKSKNFDMTKHCLYSIFNDIVLCVSSLNDEMNKISFLLKEIGVMR